MAKADREPDAPTPDEDTSKDPRTESAATGTKAATRPARTSRSRKPSSMDAAPPANRDDGAASQAGADRATSESDEPPSGPSITEPEPGHVLMTQASAASIRATTVDAHQSAAARVTGATVHVDQGAIGLVHAHEVRMADGAIGAVAADEVEFHGGFAYLVLARKVSGQVTVLLDWRAAAAAVAVLLVLGRLLRGRR